MTTTRTTGRTTTAQPVTIAGALEELFEHGIPFRFTAYDGSAAGAADAPVHLHLRNERGLSYILTAPGDLGMPGPTSPATSSCAGPIRATPTT
jgi:cyclopropane-fatty-acyl-phospholipid synthase